MQTFSLARAASLTTHSLAIVNNITRSSGSNESLLRANRWEPAHGIKTLRVLIMRGDTLLGIDRPYFDLAIECTLRWFSRWG